MLNALQRLELVEYDIDPETNCKLLKNVYFTAGYYMLRSDKNNSKKIGAHVLICMLKYNLTEVPHNSDGEKLRVRHSEFCQGRRNCINPEHLMFGTAKDNAIDTVQQGRHLNFNQTHCKNGHEFNEENTYFGKNSNGNPNRTCKICKSNNHKNSFYKENMTSQKDISVLKKLEIKAFYETGYYSVSKLTFMFKNTAKVIQNILKLKL